MASTSAVSLPAQRLKKDSQPKQRAWWWTDSTVGSDQERAVASSETELLNAAVLCAALSATQSEPSATDKQANDHATRELEMHVRKSPLPHSLQLPVLAFTPDYVLMQSELAVICAVRATKPADVLQTVVGSAVPSRSPTCTQIRWREDPRTVLDADSATGLAGYQPPSTTAQEDVNTVRPFY